MLFATRVMLIAYFTHVGTCACVFSVQFNNGPMLANVLYVEQPSEMSLEPTEPKYTELCHLILQQNLRRLNQKAYSHYKIHSVNQR